VTTARGWYTFAVAIALALISAVMYGVSDFVGGRASRRHPATAVALAGELVILLVCLACVPLVESSEPTAEALWWGLVAGATSSVAIVGLYVALARGNMTVVAPVTGIVAAVVPVIAGVAMGERPSALAVVGIVVAIVAVGLIGGVAELLGSSGSRPAIAAGTVLLAAAVGFGFGLLFIALAQPGEDTGLWPLLFARFTGVPVLVVAYWMQRRRTTEPISRGLIVPGAVIGLLIAGSNVSYLLSTREGLLSIVAVVVAMYPASTICLASVIDGERATRWQITGMATAVVALVMITSAS
jgi:drug/metabolite transporter (DMT)-like permease